MCQSIKNLLRHFLVCIWFCAVCVISGRAQTDTPIALNTADLQNGNIVAFDKFAWKYHAGDDAAWAARTFDDGDWKSVTNEQINNNPVQTLENWDGRAWFRQKITVDERLGGVTLGWRMWQWGASEIYLDGVLIKSFGAITPDGGETEYNPRGTAFPVVFTSGGGEHTIAVRYSFTAERDLTKNNWLIRGNTLPGFRLVIESWENGAERLENQRREDRIDYTFIGLFLAFAVVHFLLFIFYRAALSNLFYSFFVVGLAATFYLQNIFGAEHFSASAALLIDIVRLNAQTFSIIALLAFLYVEFLGRPSKFFWLLIAAWTLNAVLSAAQIWGDSSHTLVLLLVTFADCLRIMLRALIKRRSGAWIIAAGVFILVVGVINNISYERHWLVIPVWLYHINLYSAVFSVPLTVSLYLARNFARTNRQLETQLEQVKELSARQIESERAAAELRLAHERTQAENERRAQELEEARQLQLSMLPKKLPQIAGLEIAAYMKPATEVGGDYYDFYVGKDGTLTVAVGDATGHGLKAGSVVTATKSLFNVFADEQNIPQVFNQMSGALKAMNLRGLFMAMTILKFKSNQVVLSSAGMPSTLVYRNATNSIEEISIKAMPLGSMVNFPYREESFAMSGGDCIIIMSDGFPEMFNAENEMLGFEKAGEILPKIADKSSQEIINHLVETAEQWAGARPADDDVTFVVLKAIG